VQTETTGGGPGAPGTDAVDVLLPAKKRAAFYGLFVAVTSDVVAFASSTPGSPLRLSYLVMIGVYVALACLAPPLRFGPRFELIAIAAIGCGIVARYTAVLFATDEIVGAGSGHFAVHAGLIAVYLLAFTAFDKKRAGAASICIMLGSIVLLGLRLAAEVDLDLRIEGQPHFRTFTVHAICIALLYVLSDSKEQMQRSREAASALTVVAGTDELTGLANRRTLSRILEREMARSDRHLAPLSVVIVDLDHFKAVNDTHGHAAGDLVLQRVADVLGESVRAGDVAGRWGGEEFLILAVDASADRAVALAERCRRGIRELSIPGVGRVTASFGVASHVVGDTFESLVARADDALYAAKANGRDRVEPAVPADRPTGGSDAPLPGPSTAATGVGP
jgi:diguanylate cyclase (GGDEF)-like protein